MVNKLGDWSLCRKKLRKAGTSRKDHYQELE